MPKRVLTMLAIQVLAAAAAHAVLTIQLNQVFSGASIPGSTPYLTATFTDVATSATTCGLAALSCVQLDMHVNNLGGGFVTEWDFNNDHTGLTAMSFVAAGTNTINATSTLFSPDAFKADGDGLYDVQFNFSPSPPRFSSGDVIYYLSGNVAITAADFSALSSQATPADANGPFTSAAHIQGINPASCSAWISDSASGGHIDSSGLTGTCGVVPEPLYSGLGLGCGLLAAVGLLSRTIHKAQRTAA
jgi:hypothetical protein